MRTIGGELRLKTVKHFLWKAVRIGRRLYHERRYRADQRCLGHPAFAMPTQIARHLAAAGPLSAKLLKNGTLKTYKDFPHGMPTTQADTINSDLLAFIKS